MLKNIFYEFQKFDPALYLTDKIDSTSVKYPYSKFINNSTAFDGIIEPLHIRPVIASFSGGKYDDRSFKGQFGAGNISSVNKSTDSILSVDYYSQTSQNQTYFLDSFGLTNSSGSVSLGIGNFTVNSKQNISSPFEDSFRPRGQKNNVDVYGSDLNNTINRMSPEGESYVNSRQKSATCGLIYDNAPSGTDSIAFGGILY